MEQSTSHNCIDKWTDRELSGEFSKQRGMFTEKAYFRRSISQYAEFCSKVRMEEDLKVRHRRKPAEKLLRQIWPHSAPAPNKRIKKYKSRYTA